MGRPAMGSVLTPTLHAFIQELGSIVLPTNSVRSYRLLPSSLREPQSPVLVGRPMLAWR